MTDYTKLVESLRCGLMGDDECRFKECPYWSELGCKDGIIASDAADAIEALQAELAISKGAIRILNYNIEQMREDRMKLIEKEMARLKWEVSDENISKFADGEWWKEARE